MHSVAAVHTPGGRNARKIHFSRTSGTPAKPADPLALQPNLFITAPIRPARSGFPGRPGRRRRQGPACVDEHASRFGPEARSTDSSRNDRINRSSALSFRSRSRRPIQRLSTLDQYRFLPAGTPSSTESAVRLRRRSQRRPELIGRSVRSTTSSDPRSRLWADPPALVQPEWTPAARSVLEVPPISITFHPNRPKHHLKFGQRCRTGSAFVRGGPFATCGPSGLPGLGGTRHSLPYLGGPRQCSLQFLPSYDRHSTKCYPNCFGAGPLLGIGLLDQLTVAAPSYQHRCPRPHAHP